MMENTNLQIQKIKLFHNSAPLYQMNYQYEDTTIWIKRDDTLDFAFGGNKVRIYEYLAEVIVKSNCSRVVTYGSVFSNYLRVTAAVCAKLGISCDLIILDKELSMPDDTGRSKEIRGGNSILLNFFDANIIYCKLADAHDFINDYQQKLRAKKISFLWIPGGGHMPEGAFGYVDAAVEIQEQIAKENIHIDAVFLPCGTGTTQAGLIYGFKNTNVQVIGITVSRSVSRCKNEIKDTLESMKKIKHETDECNFPKYDVIQGEEVLYGHTSGEIENTMKKIANTDGIFLDPVYNAKAFNGMERYLREHNGLKNVLYINTGGEPNIFM